MAFLPQPLTPGDESGLQAARIHILPQPLGLAEWICQRDISIRPDEIERPGEKTGSAHPWLPGELMEWKPKLAAQSDQARLGVSIDVHLPSQRSERYEVVPFGV